MVTTLAGLPGGLLPPTVVAPIFNRVAEVSAVQRLARKVPLALDSASSIPVSMDIGVADWVGENAPKPVGNGQTTIKQMTSKKVALIVPASKEVVRTNAAGVYDQLKQDLPVAIARAFDFAAIHGKSLRTGNAGPFENYLLQTTNSVEIGTATQANGGLYADLVGVEDLVVQDGYDFTGWAADPRLRPKAKLQVDTTGRPIWVDTPQQGLGSGELIGYPAYYNRGVSGAYPRQGSNKQLLTISGTPSGGTFTVSGNGATTTAIAYNAAASAVQTAIRLLGGAFTLVTVTGSAGGPYTITLGAGAPAPSPLTASGAALTGGTSPAATVTSIAPTPTSLRAVGGDWSQAAWGAGMDLTVQVSTEASYVDENGNVVSAFQNNLVLLLVEASFGFVMGDPNAFGVAIDAV